MKRILFGLVAAAVMAFGLNLSSASASTITLGTLASGDNDVGTHHLSGADAPTLPGITFSLASQANVVIDITYSALVGSGINITTAGLFNTPGLVFQSPSGSLPGVGAFELSYTNLAAGNYVLSLTGAYFGNNAFLGGIVNVANTPIPASLLLFVTAFGGLGALGYRRRSLPTA
jgi:hypothetical protein